MASRVAGTDVRLGKKRFRGTIENKGFTNQRFVGNETRRETRERSRNEGTKPMSYGPFRHETSARILLDGEMLKAPPKRWQPLGQSAQSRIRDPG